MTTAVENPEADSTTRDFFHEVDCPLCGSAKAEPVTGMICDGVSHNVKEPYRSLSTQMSRCSDCGFVYQRQQLTKEHLAAFYDVEDYHCYKSFSERGLIIRKLAEHSSRKLIAEFERYRPKDNNILVDFGCGNGSWLELFQKCHAPWDLYGTEIDASNIEHIKKLGFKGFTCDDNNVDEFFEPGSVGMIWMHHVIEHVSSPLETFRRLRRILAPGGIIVGQTPNADCLERKLFKDHWSQWHQPHHLSIFDIETMAKHADKAEMELVRVKSSPSAATQWAGSILKSWSAKRDRTYRWSHEPLHAPLTLVFAPLSVLQCWFGKTSHMDFILRKPIE